MPSTTPTPPAHPSEGPGGAHRASAPGADDRRLPVVEDAQAAWADEAAEPVVPSPGSSRLWWVVGGLLVACAVAFAVWAGVGNARDAVSFHDVGYHVDSASQVTARWQVSKPRDKEVTCLVRALDKTFGVVGAVDVRVPAGVTDAVRTTVVKTTSLAVTGTVRSCEIVR